MKKAKVFFAKYGTCYAFLSFWLILFIVFTIIPIAMAVGFSFTNFDMVQTPHWIGADNYLRMFLDDDVFIKAFMNTMLFAVVTGPLGYILSFGIGWLINDLGRIPRTILTFLFYSPSLIGASYVMWTYLFSGDAYGLINSFLLKLGIITAPIQWLTDPSYNFYVVVVVVLWGSMGAGFLSFFAGFQSLNRSYFEAGCIDGIRNRWQELRYITLPSMSHMLLFSAVMQIQSSFSISAVAVELAGYPSVQYSVDTIVTHMSDMATVRYELGYASAIAVVLFAMMAFTRLIIGKALNTVSR